MKRQILLLLSLLLLSVIIIPSCDEETEEIPSITVTLDKRSIVADGNETITFTVNTDDGEDVTSESEFHINNEIIEGNTFSTFKRGNYSCIAYYKTALSNKVDFTVKEKPIFVKNTLIENYTAVWCGYCPRVHDEIIDAMLKDDRIIPVAIHGSDDPYYFTSIGSLASEFGVSGYPTGIIDRDYIWPYPETFSGLNDALNKNAALGLSIDTEISGNNVNANIKVKFGKDFSKDLKLVICLVESELIHDQGNYSGDGRGNPIPNYKHNNVLRSFATDLFGDEIPSASIFKDNEYVQSVSFDVTDYDVSNCTVVAYVVNADGESFNVQEVIAGNNKGYELISD